MQKENVVKKIFIRSVIGFPIGVTLLMLSYICVYIFLGEDTFNLELYQLHNINTFILQIVSFGIFGCTMLFSFELFNSMNTPTNKNFAMNHPWKTQFIILLDLTCEFIIAAFLLTNSIFNENIVVMNIVLALLSYTFFGIFLTIKALIQENLIRKINQKIKKRN